MARSDYQIPILRRLEDRLRRLTGHPSHQLIEVAMSCGVPTDIRTTNAVLQDLERQIRDAMRVDL